MAWFNDIQSGIYNLVGMIDPSDPGYQGMLKAQQTDMYKKQLEEAVAASKVQRASATGHVTGYAPEGMKYTPTSGMARQLADVNSGRPLNEAVQNNMMQYLIGGLSPAETAMGSLNPDQAGQAARYSTSLEMTPQQTAANDLQKENLAKMLKSLEMQDKWHQETNKLGWANLGENVKNREMTRLLSLMGHNLNREKFEFEKANAGAYSGDQMAKDEKSYFKAHEDIIKVTGDPMNPLSVQDALNYASRNAASWAVPAARLIKSGRMTPEQVINDLIYSIAGPNADPQKVEMIKAKLGEVISGTKNAERSTFESPVLEGMRPEARTMAQDFAALIQKGFGITPEFTSGYRNPEHNAAVGGVPNSLHVAGRAVDMVMPGLPPEKQELIRQMAIRLGFNEALWHGEGDNFHFHLGA